MYRLKELDKPFILILPTQKINSQYMRNTFKDKLQIMEFQMVELILIN